MKKSKNNFLRFFNFLFIKTTFFLQSEAKKDIKQIEAGLKHEKSFEKQNKSCNFMRNTKKCCLTITLLLIIFIVLGIIGYFVAWDLIKREFEPIWSKYF